MSSFYITFGHGHAHSVGGRTFDKDCVAVVEAADEIDARRIAFYVFGREWHQCLAKPPEMHYFPRGLLALN